MFIGLVVGRPGLWEALLILGLLVLIFGTSRFTSIKDSFVKAARNFNSSAKGDSKE